MLSRTVTKQPPRPMLRIAEQQLRKNFAKRPFTFAHELSQHPLFSLSELVELSKRLPAERVEYNRGDLPIHQSPENIPGNELSVSQTIEQILHCDSWLVLKHIQSDARYRELLDACLDEVEASLPVELRPIFSRVGFIFISSPRAVTPFHIDPENNILLQVTGNKEIRWFSADDRDAVSEQELEAFYSGGHRNLKGAAGLATRSDSTKLQPGDALHIPQHSPHYVLNGAEVSISFSITFQTRQSDRVQAVYWCNEKIRRLGIRPSPPEKSTFADECKYRLYATLRGIKRALRTQE